MQNRMVRGLTWIELKSLMTEMEKHHQLIEGRSVKYVDFSFDFRTHTFWSVNIRPFGVAKEFCTANRFDYGKHNNLYDEIMEWLREGKRK